MNVTDIAKKIDIEVDIAKKKQTSPNVDRQSSEKTVIAKLFQT
jgi:hypothetical protein